MDKQRYKIGNESMLHLLTAGKAEFSIQNEISKKHYTYLLTQARHPQSEGATVFFVKVCYDYLKFHYAGVLVIDDKKVTYAKGAKGKLAETAESIKGLLWLFNKLVTQQKVTENVGVYHFGKCARCGRTLTDPQSIVAGLGPECRRM